MALRKGIILLWFGTVGSIPPGYVLCDGNNDTPDLRDRFIVGAGDSYAVNERGGNLSHDHDFTSDGHNHTIQAGAGLGPGASFSLTTSTDVDSGTTDPESSLPPYHALLYIMKT